MNTLAAAKTWKKLTKANSFSSSASAPNAQLSDASEKVDKEPFRTGKYVKLKTLSELNGRIPPSDSTLNPLAKLPDIRKSDDKGSARSANRQRANRLSSNNLSVSSELYTLREEEAQAPVVADRKPATDQKLEPESDEEIKPVRVEVKKPAEVAKPAPNVPEKPPPPPLVVPVVVQEKVQPVRMIEVIRNTRGDIDDDDDVSFTSDDTAELVDGSRRYLNESEHTSEKRKKFYDEFKFDYTARLGPKRGSDAGSNRLGKNSADFPYEKGALKSISPHQAQDFNNFFFRILLV